MYAHKQLRGSTFFGFVIAFVLGGIIGAGIACLAGWICSNGGGGGGGGSTTLAPNQCVSSPNECGLTNIGTLVPSGRSMVCNATPPDNSGCPQPVVTDFTATPVVVGVDGHSTLTWDIGNATSITITGDNGFSYTSTSATGSVDTGILANTTTFTLVASDGSGGPQTTKSVRVVVDPHYKEL